LRPPRSPLFPYTTLSRSQGEVGEAQWQGVGDKTTKAALPRGRAVEAWARHNTRHGGRGDVLTFLEGLEPEKLRAFGYAGVALGVDRKSTRLNSSHVKISY